MWKEAAVAWCNILARNLRAGAQENHKNPVSIDRLRAEIWTQDLLDMKQKC
jgi:hypothetical protein